MSNTIDKQKLVEFINNSAKILTPSESLFYDGQIQMLYTIRDQIQSGAFDIPNNQAVSMLKRLDAFIDFTQQLDNGDWGIEDVNGINELFDEITDFLNLESTDQALNTSVTKPKKLSFAAGEYHRIDSKPSVDRVMEQPKCKRCEDTGGLVRYGNKGMGEPDIVRSYCDCEIGMELGKEETKDD